MKTIVLGKGFLGKKFEEAGFEVWGRDRFEMNYFDEGICYGDKLRDLDVIINCMAKSNTRWCEKPENFHEALWSNGTIPRLLSGYCKANGKKFVHISTGCLYDSHKWNQYGEEEKLTAHCNYTVSKWVGEQGCRPEHDLVIRPRLLFGDFQDRNNLLCKLPAFTRYVDRFNSFSSVNVVVEAVTALLEHNQSGVFNVACDGAATVWTLAQWMGLEGQPMTERHLHEAEGIFLVNNVMDLTKLKQFYMPPTLKDEVLRCWKAIQ